MRQGRDGGRKLLMGWVIAAALAAGSMPARAEIDGHGPDAWRVTGVAARDMLNARMGPGTAYPVLTRFSPDERGMRQVTCVPYYTPAPRAAMSRAEFSALPPRWCLMRSADLARTGWVNAAYLDPDHGGPAGGDVGHELGDDLIVAAEELVRTLYEMRSIENSGGNTGLYRLQGAKRYFHLEVARAFVSGQAGADPIYGAQDFDGRCEEPRRDADRPMFRGMITVHVDCVNFGRPQRATFSLRADPDQAGAPVRIFRIDHDGWSFP
ncbi:hypothetical protein GN330_01860 [Nitratireductor sp. CAU 1489]|uniref:Uncharacterized protein n=1 Tax=Nitratireductor arenosus TaxID=2682096 RepID=A0A844QA17_9HYPH|nr:hypothetical protein [Nitratireductor arenosus]MVA96002.1 hypothetical protein [Nitratireductor arenosus]